MKRLAALLALSSVLAVAACDDPGVLRDEELADAPMEASVAPYAEDTAAPAADPAAVDAPAVSPETLPPEKQSSEETVQPESETLFY